MSVRNRHNSDILGFYSCFILSNKERGNTANTLFTVSLKKKDKQSLKCIY